MTLSDFLYGNPWLGMVIWSVFYISDFSLTMVCAKLYRSGVNNTIVFEGSYELNPYFQSDVDALRFISPRFLGALALTNAWLLFSWWVSTESHPALYEFVVGALISIQLTVHIRHLRNLFLFRAIIQSNVVHGRIEYFRPLTLRMSSVEIFAFSGLFATVFVFTLSWFTLGGAAACFALALKHKRLAARAAKTSTALLQGAN